MHPSSWKRCFSTPWHQAWPCEVCPVLRKNHGLNPLTQKWSRTCFRNEMWTKWCVPLVSRSLRNRCTLSCPSPAATSLSMFRQKFLSAWTKAVAERWACSTRGVGGRAPSASAEAWEGGRHSPLSTWTQWGPPSWTHPRTDCWSSYRPHLLTCRL